MEQAKFTFGSLFSGIGGLDLGLERAGMTCAWMVENDDYCIKVLNKHWPDIPKYRDVRDVGKENLEPVDLIAGGFPCQPHSVAGKQKGAEDDRNLWPEYFRIIKELQPRFVLGENVLGIASSYLDTVLSDLESEIYTCATFNIPAIAFDAPHRRERIFILAYTNKRGSFHTQAKKHPAERRGEAQSQSSKSGQIVAHSKRNRSQGIREEGDAQRSAGLRRREGGDKVQGLRDTKGESIRPRLRKTESQGERGGRSSNPNWWATEPDVGRVAHGVPSRVDRLRGLGNAVVPQVAEWIGKRILKFIEL